jgi:hypothetical protein
MDQATIQAVMSKVVGDPSTGILHDAIPGMAAAVARALNGDTGADTGDQEQPAPKAEKRIIKADETR